MQLPDLDKFAEDLVDLEVPADLQISPSASKVVYSSSPLGRKGEHPVSTFWIATVNEAGSAKQLTSGFYDDRSPKWSPDGESVAFLSDRGTRGDSCAIYMLSLNGGEPYPVTDAKHKKSISQLEWGNDGKFILFTSADEDSSKKTKKRDDKDDARVYGTEWEFNRLRLLHVPTRTVDTLYSKDKDVSSFTWNPADRDQIALVVHETPEIQSRYLGATIEMYSVLAKSSRHICDLPGRLHGPLVWTGRAGDLPLVLAGTTLDAAGTSPTVYKLDVSTGTLAKYYSADDASIESLMQANGTIFYQLENGLQDSINELKYPHQPRPPLSSECFKITSWNACRLEDENSDDFADYDSLTKLSAHGSKCAVENDASLLDCFTFDGVTEVDGVFIRPRSTVRNGSKPGPLPTIVLLRGGPYGRVTKCFNPLYHYWYPFALQNSNYAVLTANYRGGSSHGEAYAAAARGGVGTVDYDDVLALVSECIRRGLIDKERIVVAGWSQGGFLSYLSAVRNGHTSEGRQLEWRYKGAICGAGVSDWDMLTMTTDIPYFEVECTAAAPWESRKSNIKARRSSAIWELTEAANAGRVPPILIIHGEEDQRVPVSQGIAFHRGCLRHKLPCELVTYPREGHMIRERAHLIDLMKRVRRFCDLHLG